MVGVVPSSLVMAHACKRFGSDRSHTEYVNHLTRLFFRALAAGEGFLSSACEVESMNAGFRRSIAGARAHAWLLLLALGLVVASCARVETEGVGGKNSDAGLLPIKVETASVTVEKMPKYLTLTGSVQAALEAEVAANVAGRITATHVERGQRVKAGQVIASVDSRAAGFSASAATAQYKVAESQVELAKQECARADTLFAQSAISEAEHDRLKMQCTAQIYQADAARANAGLAGKLAGDTTIRAPFDGIVGERYVNVGEYVQPASRVTSVFAVHPARVVISVPEPAVAQVREGQSLVVSVSAWPDRAFAAVVQRVSPNLRATTRDMIVEALADNSDGALRPGMFATVRLVVGEEEWPTVPLTAIKKDGNVRRLFVSRDGSAFEMVVGTGVEKDGRVAVLEALRAGELVVVNPPPGLRDGSAIQ
jgi:RND family efflux transporter MFP subunit